MSFGQNLQFLRRLRNNMTQEELAEKLCVSRQTVSKWELDTAYPEMNNLIELCRLFSCTMDELVLGDMNISDDVYSDIRIETVKPFSCLRYAVISCAPEDDSYTHVCRWAQKLNIAEPKIIGWDFPVLSQEQINVFNMHGYESALILSDERAAADIDMADKVFKQAKQKYICITIREPFNSPFCIIPNAYKLLMTHMKTNGLEHKEDKNIIPCFEKEYYREGTQYMDVYIAIC